MSDYGEVIADGSVRMRRRLPGPIERVWSYLTEAKLRSTWFADGETELRVGGAAEHVFHNSRFSGPGESVPDSHKKDEGYRFVGRVTRCEPPRVLAYTWDGSEVTFELEPRGAEVELTLTHVRLANRGEVVSVSAGWHTHLDLLRERLHERAPRSFWSDVLRLEREYETRIP